MYINWPKSCTFIYLVCGSSTSNDQTKVDTFLAGPGIATSILTGFYTFVETDHQIFYIVILLPLIQEGLLSDTSESMCTKCCLTG